MKDHTFKIRMAAAADAEELLKIYTPYVLKTAITFEYEVPSAEEFRERIARTLIRFPYLAAVKNGEILGYAYVSPFQSRAAYGWAAETSIYVKEDCRGEGVGHRLYEALEEILRQQNIINLEACIAYPNPESVRFHENHGYKTVARFTKCGYKMGQWYDMIWMEKMLGGHPKEPALVIPITSEIFRHLF